MPVPNVSESRAPTERPPSLPKPRGADQVKSRGVIPPSLTASNSALTGGGPGCTPEARSPNVWVWTYSRKNSNFPYGGRGTHGDRARIGSIRIWAERCIPRSPRRQHSLGWSTDCAPRPRPNGRMMRGDRGSGERRNNSAYPAAPPESASRKLWTGESVSY